jgi:hypothetical protein
MSRSGLFTTHTVYFFLNLFGRSVSVIRDIRTEIFERHRLFEILAFVSLSWFIVRRARRRTADFVQMPPRLSITAWARRVGTIRTSVNTDATVGLLCNIVAAAVMCVLMAIIFTSKS